MADSKKQILNQIQNLITNIKTKLHKSILLSNKKKLQILPQSQLLVGGLLKDYQLEGLSWMIELATNGLSGILADDMGLGKTIQAIAYLTYIQQSKGIKGKHLIVVPKNVLKNWKRQLNNWNPTLQTVILPGTQDQRQQTIQKYIKTSKFDVLVATYFSVQSAENHLKKFFWETLIVDEAHSIKNEETYLACSLRKLKKKFALLLTGTPLSNQLKELWSLLNFVAPQIFYDNELFRRIEESVNVNCKDGEQKMKYQSQIASRFKAIIKPFLLRRVKSEVNLGLKEKKQMTLFVSLTDLQLKMYRNYLKTSSVYGNENETQMNRHIQLRKICSHPYIFSDIQDPSAPSYGQHLIQNSGKLKILDKLLKKLLHQKHKILVFCQFIGTIKILEDFCTYRQHKYCVISGESSIQQRDESVEQFSNSPNINVFLISTRAGGIGLNLVAADIVILFDLDWNPQMDKQAMDRAYRIGQDKNVLVFKLITNNTIEERMLQVQKYKLIWDELVIQKGGLTKFKSAEEKFQKVDENYIAGISTSQIFKLQQNYDDKTIDELIQISMERDEKKTQQIRNKLSKQFQQVCEANNPYQILYDEDDGSQNAAYNKQVVGHLATKKNEKLNWRERQNKQAQKQNIVIPQPYYFFEDNKLAGELLFKIQQEDTGEKEKEQYKKQLCDMGFYQWKEDEVDSFVEGNLEFDQHDYEAISRVIKSKTAEEVKKYSEKYFSSASRIPCLQKNYRKILTKQKQLARRKQMQEMHAKILNYPCQYFNFKQKSSIKQMSHDTLVRLYFNGIKESGICFDECQQIIELVNPAAVHKLKKYVAGKHRLYSRTIEASQKVNQKQVKVKMEKKYKQLMKKYMSEQKEDKQIIQTKDNDSDSVQTVLKETIHLSQ